jgi:Ca2+-binding RTX toxin-like protein
MAYNQTGTAGNDTINQSQEIGAGTIVGLAGSDCLFTGTGQASVDGGPGNDDIVLQGGNTGTAVGGPDNDFIRDNGTNIGSMILAGNEGADTITAAASTNRQTITGGNDASDGPDSLVGSTAADVILGNGGNDTIDGTRGSDTMVGGAGNDTIFSTAASFNYFIFGNEGNDTIAMPASGTVFGGQGDDSIDVREGGTLQLFGGEGNDTIDAFATGVATILGGNDSADGNDHISGSIGNDVIFGNGGADTILTLNPFSPASRDTIIGGFSGDAIQGDRDNDFIYGNEGDDTIADTGGDNTVFAGQGDDNVALGSLGSGNTLVFGNEGNDTIAADADGDTVTLGPGADVFRFLTNGTNLVDVTEVTDLNWGEDRFRVLSQISFASNVDGLGVSGATLAARANSALQIESQLANGSTQVAAQFTFSGRTYVVINQNSGVSFDEASDLLVDITGFVGSISSGRFFV